MNAKIIGLTPLINNSLIFMVLFTTGMTCFSTPLNTRAMPHLNYLVALLQRPVEERRVPNERAVDYIAVLRHDSQDSAVCAALILAWADDEASGAALSGCLVGSEVKEQTVIGAAASYAMRIRKIRATKQNYFTSLCDALRGTKDSFEVLFFADRLWGDCGTRSLPVICEVARLLEERFKRGELRPIAGEENAYLLVMPELFRYLAETDSPALAEQAVKLQDWRDAFTQDGLQTILRFTRPKNSPRLHPAEARRRLEKLRMQTQRNKSPG